RRRQDDHGAARSAHPSLPYPGDRQRQLPLQGERCGTQNTKGKTRPLTVLASRETIVQPGQFSMTIPGQFLATINTQNDKAKLEEKFWGDEDRLKGVKLNNDILWHRVYGITVVVMMCFFVFVFMTSLSVWVFHYTTPW